MISSVEFKLIQTLIRLSTNGVTTKQAASNPDILTRRREEIKTIGEEYIPPAFFVTSTHPK
jgi:hypothetical protein